MATCALPPSKRYVTTAYPQKCRAACWCFPRHYGAQRGCGRGVAAKTLLLRLQHQDTPALRRRKNVLRTLVSNRDGREASAAPCAPTLDMRTLCTLGLIPLGSR